MSQRKREIPFRLFWLFIPPSDHGGKTWAREVSSAVRENARSLLEDRILLPFLPSGIYYADIEALGLCWVWGIHFWRQKRYRATDLQLRFYSLFGSGCGCGGRREGRYRLICGSVPTVI